MNKLTLPKNPYKGLKIFCRKCNIDNSDCRHYDQQVYRVRIHVPGTRKKVKSKVLNVLEYKDAVVQAVEFEKKLISNNFSITETISEEDGNNEYSILGASIKYNQYLNGESYYAHLKKNISKEYKNELIRYCYYFCENVKKNKDIETSRIQDINIKDVSNFYSWAETHYQEKSFNKCMAGVKGFFEFLIKIEKVVMENPFEIYVAKVVVGQDIDTITKEEFELILGALNREALNREALNREALNKEVVNNCDSMQQLGGKGQRKDMYRPYLKDGFRLFLLVGGRREEIVDLRWSDIFTTSIGTKFFRIENLKVTRAKKNKEKKYKYIPINDDLDSLLLEMGYNEKYGTTDYILLPDRIVKSKIPDKPDKIIKSKTIMDLLSKAFTHYRKGVRIEKDISLKTLRKTYLTWVNQVMNQETKILSSHSTDGVLKDYYLDPTILSAIEKGALEIKIFG